MRSLLQSFVALVSLGWTAVWALSQTMGTPLGGMGTGYMVFNARTGDFATSSKIMPSAFDTVSEFSNKQSTSSGFHFFANGKSMMKAHTASEDAKCPAYYADFGDVEGVTFALTAFGPFIPGSDANAQLAQSPLAFFEITAVNAHRSAADVTVALEFANQNAQGTSLLGGATSGMATAGGKALAYGTDTTENAYLFSDCSGNATYNAGALGAFATDGTITSGAGNVVAAKCTIDARNSARFKFVFAWWRQFRNATRGNEDFFYHNFYKNSREVAEYGLARFDAIKAGATSIVNRVLATNFPEWYKDRLLNNLYPMIHNSQCAKDGRVGFWEGKYPIIGTIDQAQHAALWYTFNWPSNQWRELQFWARSSHKGIGEDASLKGQIHHDFNAAADKWTTETHFMCGWEDYLRTDYIAEPTYQPNTIDWSDLNSMFIFKAYELMLATGDRDSLKRYWDYVKNTADRLITQCGSSHLPIKTSSTYSHDSIMGPYVSGIALVAWQCVNEMAKFLNDTASMNKYSNWYSAARAEFAQKNFNENFATGRKVSEADVAGYGWARYFGFPAIMDSQVVTTGCNRLWTYYSGLSDTRAKLGLWHFYTYDHWGGAAIAIGQADAAMVIHKWDYDYYYAASPGYVFWQDFQNANNSYASYMTACNVWRSYFQMTGTLVDNANNRLWIRPMPPSSMCKRIENAPIINPKGWGTLTYDENPLGAVIQAMTVTFDSLVAVREIVLKNNASVDSPSVAIIKNGDSFPLDSIRIEGGGYEKNIRVFPSQPFQIGLKEQGVNIKLYNGPIPAGTMNHNGSSPARPALFLGDARIAAGLPIHFSLDATGPVTLDLIRLNGAKAGTILSKVACAGKQSFFWNGRFTNGRKASAGAAVVRLRSSAGTISKKVLVER